MGRDIATMGLVLMGSGLLGTACSADGASDNSENSLGMGGAGGTQGPQMSTAATPADSTTPAPGGTAATPAGAEGEPAPGPGSSAAGEAPASQSAEVAPVTDATPEGGTGTSPPPAMDTDMVRDELTPPMEDMEMSRTPPAGGNCLQGSGGDFAQDGPYEVTTEEVTIGDSGDFTIYIPQPLEENCPHPMVAWGNGTTVPGGTAYRHYNERMATWGIIAIASHDDGTASSGPRIGDGSFHRAAIDHLLAENERPDSQFFGRVSGRAGVSGHSQGGAGGDRASTHPNVEANGNVQGSFGRAPADVAFLCLTGTDDIAVEGCMRSVDGTSSPAMYASYAGMGHNASVSPRAAGSQGYARMLSGWFRCFLADDNEACAMFMGGDSCPVCQEPEWDSIYSANY